MSEAKHDHIAETEQAASETTTADAAPAADGIDPFDALRAERDELKDRLLRTLAESENVRKRADRDRREAEKFGGTRIVRDLMPVYDNLRRALNSAADAPGQADAALIEGVELTQRELLNVLAKHGVTVITPKPGDRFDPETHEAVFEAPVPGTKAGDILQVMSEGFVLHDRLVRPAQVGVSSNTGG